ncbi:NSFL1 cofactor p47-like [Trichogramma pretiosum]|uniref:NSFL1 cofactor p47-like n=1 Tax=Trichogramma pretiosum TaxID=7493 RepID=UPI000C719B25|nr:NSFL1 cofactor p47-like [Trichogramma pretiosum]
MPYYFHIKMDQNREDMIARFIEATGVDKKQAELSLESSAWSIGSALANFFEENSNSDFDMEEEDNQVKKSKSKPKKKANFATIRDFQDTDSSSDEEGQAFFTGGGGSTGQQILGPDEMKHMCPCCNSAELNKPSDKPETFGGLGYKLGMTNEDTEVVGTPSPGTSKASSARPTEFRGIGYKLGMTNEDTEVVGTPSSGTLKASSARPTEFRGIGYKLGMTSDDTEVVGSPAPGKASRPSARSKMFRGLGYKLGLTNDDTKVVGTPSPSASNRSFVRPTEFRGLGYKLGLTSEDTEVVGTPLSVNQASSSDIVSLKLWKNGFTVNNKELRRYEDPDSKKLLDTIKGGAIPEEIRSEVAGNVLTVEVENRWLEDYTPQKDEDEVFAGKGHMLESSSSPTVEMALPVDVTSQAANEAIAKTPLNLDTNLPVTSLQIRLADGSNLRAQFNLTHTIADVRNYIINMKPQYALRTFILNTVFPAKELSEEDKTIEDANLQNSTIMLRLK